MQKKKNESTFTLSFNPSDPKHKLAIDTLNCLKRKKSAFLAALIEAAARHPEAFGLICMQAGVNAEGYRFEGDIRDSELLISMVEGSGFKRVNKRRAYTQNPADVSQNKVCIDTPDKKSSVVSKPADILVPMQNSDIPVLPESEIPAHPDAEMYDGDDDNILSPELVQNLLANVQFFDELSGDDEE